MPKAPTSRKQAPALQKYLATIHLVVPEEPETLDFTEIGNLLYDVLLQSKAWKELVFQFEVGETDVVHLQLAGKLQKRARITTCEALFVAAAARGDIDKHFKAGHWEPVNTVGESAMACWSKAKTYCSKEKGRIAGPWIYPKNTVYCGQDLPKDLYPWQKEMQDIFKGPVDNRAIYWLYESTGNTGKTTFAKMMCFRHDWAVVGGKGADFLHGAMKCPDAPGFVVCLSRAHRAENGDKHYIAFSALESVKDGIFFNTKYESRQILRCSPHMCVIANWRPSPDECQSMLSRDRWRIGEIRPDKKIYWR